MHHVSLAPWCKGQGLSGEAWGWEASNLGPSPASAPDIGLHGLLLLEPLLAQDSQMGHPEGQQSAVVLAILHHPLPTRLGLRP